jgi:hypothetical protein
LTLDGLCADGGGVVEKVTFYEAVQMKRKEQDPDHFDLDSPLLARKARYVTNSDISLLFGFTGYAKIG